MWLMYVDPASDELDPVIEVVDGDGALRCSTSDVAFALGWLASIGQRHIGIPVGDGVQVYATEAAGPSSPELDDLALRHALLAGWSRCGSTACLGPARPNRSRR